MCFGVALVGAACNAAAPVPEFDETPMIALLITSEPPSRPQPPSGAIGADSGLYATLLTTGTPLRSPYLRADRFEMRRVSDGARYAWRPIDPGREAFPVHSLAAPNYFLPRRDNADGLGSDSIAPGGVYELVAEAGPHRIIGRTRVPGRIEFVRAPTDGDSIVRWRRTPGAAGYAVGPEFFFFGLQPPLQDTVVVVRQPPPAPGQPAQRIMIRVFALDSNYAVFRSDFRASRAGITGGWGVFGSFTWADTELPASP